MLVYHFVESALNVLILGIIIASIWIYFDARKRGENFIKSLLWSVGTLFLSVFVFPVWFWIRPNFMKEKENLCHECNEIYKGKPACCPTCGHVFLDGIVDQSNMDFDEKTY